MCKYTLVARLFVTISTATIPATDDDAVDESQERKPHLVIVNGFERPDNSNHGHIRVKHVIVVA